MGTECISSTFKDESDELLFPPGFASFPSFAVENIQNDVKTSPSPCNPEHSQSEVKCNITDDKQCRKSQRLRRNINYSQFDNSSDEGSDSEIHNQDAPTKRQLPKGIIRGCADCKDCQKVIARWNPDAGSKLSLDEAPVFYPTEEEFDDTLKYIESIRLTAQPYGICRIVPPPSWKPHCPLKEKGMWDNMKFSTRVQRIDKLQKRESFKKQGRYRKRRKLLQKQQQSNDRFGFEPGPDFTLEAFKKYADDFVGQYFAAGLIPEPSVENIESEYWRIVERPTEEIEVLYGADVDTANFGSGFSKASSMTESGAEDRYTKSGWNLNNFPKLSGSVLRFESGDISGVLVPWLYIGMCFSSFCWHVEDHHLYSLNYMHWGAPKMWYGVPETDALKLEAAMKKHLPDLFEEQPDLLHNLVTQFSPSLLRSEGVSVYRCIQREGEFVLTFPRAYHAGFNCGFNCAEAVNVAPVDWLPMGHNAVELYREQGRKISVSHDKLLFGAAREAVKAQWDISFLKKNNADNLMWKNFCGVDGILTNALKLRIQKENAQREVSCSSQLRKMDSGFDATDRECAICHYDLHLSAISCSCNPDRFVCLLHAKELCACDMSGRLLLYRYDIPELNMLADALASKLSAIHRYGISYLGLTLGKSTTKEKAQEIKPADHVKKESTPQGEITHNVGRLDTVVGRIDSMQAPIASLQNRSGQVNENFDKTTPSDGEHKDVKFSSTLAAKSVNLSDLKEPSRGVSPSFFKEFDRTAQGIVNGDNANTSAFPSSLQQPLFNPSMKNITGEYSAPMSNLERKVTGDIIHNELPGVGKLCVTSTFQLQERRQDTSTVGSQPLSRVIACSSSATLCNAMDDHVLRTPGTTASVMREKEAYVSPITGQKLASQLKTDGASWHTASSTFSVGKLIPELSHVKHGSDDESIERPPGFGDERPSEMGNRKAELLPERGSTAAGPSCVFGGPNVCSVLNKGPRLATIVRKFNYSVQVLEYGVILSDRRWSSRQSIFPKGFRSRVKYISILDPTQMCFYISEIVDAGHLGPLFMVTLEQCPDEKFIEFTANKCWNMVRERVNTEIRRQHTLGRTNILPVPPGSINGLEMFGLTSPSIIQVIESLDRDRACIEYWQQHPPPPDIMGYEQSFCKNQTNHGCFAPSNSLVTLEGLLKKACQQELNALLNLLNNAPAFSKEKFSMLLQEEIARRKNG